jgi:hypothetical protein
MKRINKNEVSLAGEFAVLSQLSLRGIDANMTLGHTKGIDILAYSPEKGKSYQLEVKTHLRSGPNKPSVGMFGTVISSWMMNKKHERINEPTHFYCFVDICQDRKSFEFYIVPSKVVARYVTKEHEYWLNEHKKKRKKIKPNDIRLFRLGLEGSEYPIDTPRADQYRDNWNFIGARKPG